MTTRRDFLLQQLGVIQWKLRYPAALHGEVALKLPETTRLLIISTPRIAANDALLMDVLRGLSLTHQQIAILTPEQYAMLEDRMRYLHWWLGCEPIERHPHKTLYSPALTALYSHPEAKRALWQQICHDEQHFLAHGS